MRKKFSFDIHGVLDDLPETFVALNSALYKAGHEIHIVTGITQSEEVLEEIWNLGMRWHKFFSIVDYHKSIGTEIVWGDDGRPWIDRELWNQTKSWYCEKHRIDMHFDDTQAYEPYFKTPFARVWTKNNRNGRGTKPTETALLDLHDVYMPAPFTLAQAANINAYQKNGKYPALTCHECGNELYATMFGVQCLCGYKQTWVHKFRASNVMHVKDKDASLTIEVIDKEPPQNPN